MKKTNYKRINITLPEKTIEYLERIAKKENKPKSRIIDTAIVDYYNKHRISIRNYFERIKKDLWEERSF